jgi:hypothetical protein
MQHKPHPAKCHAVSHFKLFYWVSWLPKCSPTMQTQQYCWVPSRGIVFLTDTVTFNSHQNLLRNIANCI